MVPMPNVQKVTTWKELQKTPKIVIGMLHLPALPGSPLFNGRLTDIRSSLLADAEALEDGGVHAIMMENFGDIPFAQGRVGAETVAVMAALGADLRSHSSLPLGINVLRNDGESALAVAVACGAQFIRVNVLSGARVTDQGLIQGNAFDVMRCRARLNALEIAVMADVDVKHSAPLAERDLTDEVEDTVLRGLADAVIVSGAGTGKRTDPSKVKLVASAAKAAPVFLGSGVSADNIKLYLDAAKGFIVGTTFKTGGILNASVDVKRVKAFMTALTRH